MTVRRTTLCLIALAAIAGAACTRGSNLGGTPSPSTPIVLPTPNLTPLTPFPTAFPTTPFPTAFPTTPLPTTPGFPTTPPPSTPPPATPGPSGSVPTADSVGTHIQSNDSTYSGSFDRVQDDTATIALEVPVEWSDRDTRPLGEEAVPSIFASTDLEGFISGWTTPGVEFDAFPGQGSADVAATMSDSSPDPCNPEGEFEYDDTVYRGRWSLWSGCGGEDTVLIVIAAAPASDDVLLRLFIQLADQGDLVALETIIRSFTIT